MKVILLVYRKAEAVPEIELAHYMSFHCQQLGSHGQVVCYILLI